FYGSGRGGSVETTGLAVLALLKGGYSATVRGALTWIAEQRDPSGTWHSTQATVLALKALVSAAGKPLGGDTERRIDIAVGGEKVQDIVIAADQADVLRQIDLTKYLGIGPHRLTL